ncbi:MAG: tRNA pseudouridine(55) synthase TruB [Blastocatellia bacterium]
MANPQSAIRNPQSADGVVVIDKPADWTSHDVVAKVRKIVKTRRVGHTGTLDPFATGVLVVCVNRATRLVQFLTGDDKEYVATMRLGFATDTGDLTGEALLPVTDASHITSEQVREVLEHFRGRIRQIPPMYSAKKVGGVRLHEMARRGEEIERQPIEIEIKELELLPDFRTVEIQNSPTKTHEEDTKENPNEYVLLRDTSCDFVGKDNCENDRNLSGQDFSFRVVCTVGTYIRTLAEDIGKQLGIGAHLISLRRTRAGSCHISKAVTLEQLTELVEQDRLGEVLIPMADAVSLTEILLTDEECKAVAHGRSIHRTGIWAGGSKAKLCGSERQLLAIAEFDAQQSVWQPRAVLTEAE